MANGAVGVQVLLEFAMSRAGSVRRPVRRVHVAHGAVEVAGRHTALTSVLHLTNLNIKYSIYYSKELFNLKFSILQYI